MSQSKGGNSVPSSVPAAERIRQACVEALELRLLLSSSSDNVGGVPPLAVAFGYPWRIANHHAVAVAAARAQKPAAVASRHQTHTRTAKATGHRKPHHHRRTVTTPAIATAPSTAVNAPSSAGPVPATGGGAQPGLPNGWGDLSTFVGSGLTTPVAEQPASPATPVEAPPPASATPAASLTFNNVLVNNPAVDTTSQDTQSETSTIAFGNIVLTAYNDSGSNLTNSTKFT